MTTALPFPVRGRRGEAAADAPRHRSTRRTGNRLRALAQLLRWAACLAAGPAAAAPLGVTVTDPAGRPVEGAVVTVVVAGVPKVAPAARTAQVAQQNRQFVPQVTVVQTGTSVTFPNLDTVRHHVYSFASIRSFELKLYAGTPSVPIVFDKAGTAVLGCNIHDKMTAWVVVVDTPYFAMTDANGKARLEIPEGEHLLRVWHARQTEAIVPAEQKVHAGANIAVQLAPFAAT